VSQSPAVAQGTSADGVSQSPAVAQGTSADGVSQMALQPPRMSQMAL
jgi:hypothetical protein